MKVTRKYKIMQTKGILDKFKKLFDRDAKKNKTFKMPMKQNTSTTNFGNYPSNRENITFGNHNITLTLNTNANMK